MSAHWRRGKAFYLEAKWKLAIRELEAVLRSGQQLPFYTEARHMLGLAYLQDRQPRKAIPLLRETVLTLGHTPKAIEARLDFAEAYLASEEYAQASAGASDALREIAKTGRRADWKARALLIRAEALLELGKPDEARASIDEWEETSRGIPERSESEPLASTLKLRLKLRQCSLLAADDPMPEARYLSEIQERGLCLRESLPIVLGLAETDLKNNAVRDFKKAWMGYQIEIANPPLPGRLLTDEQKPNYLRELGEKAKEIYGRERDTAMQLLNPTAKTLPPRLQSVVSEVEKILQSS